jgi:hypothetical protein
VHAPDLAGLRLLAEEHRVRQRFVVCLESEARTTEDGIEILPWQLFLDRLWDGGIV